MSFCTKAQRHRGTVAWHTRRWDESFMDTVIIGGNNSKISHMSIEAVQTFKLVRGSEVIPARASTAIFDLIRPNGMSSSDVLIVFCVGSQTSA
jgi:hypothetical protein